LKPLLECPVIAALVAAFYANAFNDVELLKSYLAGGNRSTGKPTDKAAVEIFVKARGLSFFLSFSTVFSYLC